MRVHLGGSLVQHLQGVSRHVRRTLDRGLPAHLITIEPDTLLGSIANRDTWQVHSRHHEAVARLGSWLQVCAGIRDPEDGTIDGIELPRRRYVLVTSGKSGPADAEQRKVF